VHVDVHVDVAVDGFPLIAIQNKFTSALTPPVLLTGAACKVYSKPIIYEMYGNVGN